MIGVKIPDEVWLIIKPKGTYDDYAAFFHEAGHVIFRLFGQFMFEIMDEQSAVYNANEVDNENDPDFSSVWSSI